MRLHKTKTDKIHSYSLMFVNTILNGSLKSHPPSYSVMKRDMHNIEKTVSPVNYEDYIVCLYMINVSTDIN